MDWDSAADRAPPLPDVWTGGGLVRDEASGSAFAGADVCARLHADNWRVPALVGGHFNDLGLTPDGPVLFMCGVLSSLPGPYKLSRGLSLWDVVLALQANECFSPGC